MHCPECGDTHIRKNGKKKGKQNHICAAYGRQFIDAYKSTRGYSDEVKAECLKMYVSGSGFRAIERGKGVDHTTVIHWVKQVATRLPDVYDPDTGPQVGELDELETFVGSKKNKIWLWTVVDHFKQGILGWVLGDRSGKTFKTLWDLVEPWHCYFYVTDGWKVYPCFIPPGDQIVSKTYMPLVENENTRLRHYLARLHRKTLCYSKTVEILAHSIRLLLHYLKFRELPVLA
ncbi:IS1 family transposase [Leptolyngbya sp. FACHB-261]|uniref:IS1 family transposase n=1 Tax=Leptolyngbya sp. FACHB-261 TaxID=2692806 RepID=UPI00168465C4|nr:IS1 family transposase [Leptolyngbya sp. FACHB-261]MBD2104109.1 IS1 family transposase [Leptolyngbya sp. FACHB-261]